ncbi:MAG: hypothetical protein ACK5V3_15640 [Bdellovibrionales bacterium]
MKSLVLALLTVTSAAWSQSTQVYQGTSPVSYNQKNACQVTLVLNSQKQVIAIVTKGPAKQWEIIAENQNGYGPRTDFIYDHGDDMLSTPEDFAKMRFERKNNIWSEGYTLKSTVTAEGNIKGKFEVEFKIQNSQLLSIKKKSKFKAAFVPLASQELVCENLKKVSQR